jgi:4-alpha-glucanotransferase
MGTDAWGVSQEFADIAGNWHPTSPETRAALYRAMGVDASHSPDQGDDVIIVRPGEQPSIPQPGTITLEDGTTRHVADRLPADLPLGYHRYAQEGHGRAAWIIVTPGKCPLPPAPLWCWAVQLYAARSNESWGIGDLADLRRLARWSKSLGAGALLVNPLGTVAWYEFQQPSPYYPSSRRFLNPLYLRIEEVPGAAEARHELEPLAREARALNQQRRIDRNAVFRLKRAALEQLWKSFQGDPDFDRFCDEQGTDLELFGAFCALTDAHGPDWQKWPDDYRRPNTPQLARWMEGNRWPIRFHQWLQWLLDRQLQQAAAELPLMHDLPIGVDPGGVDSWAWQSIVAHGCSVGAPPDMYATAGQDWGLPPLVPHKLRACGYEPLVKTIRAVLRHAGALRIDHVMGFFRLFWIPQGLGPQHGAFVRYRPDEILAIVALESHRAGAYVVGEDLGTVEMGVREKLAECQIMSYKLLYFEPGPPREYPRQSMVAVTTHDLPTIAGVWSGHDLRAQQQIGLEPSVEGFENLRHRLREATSSGPELPIDEVIRRAYRLLAEAPSLIVSATLEDALAVEDRPNMPGTVDQWPNWSIALPGGLEGLEASPLAREIAAALGRHSRG